MAFVQSAKNTGSSTAASPAALSPAPTSGNLLVAFVNSQIATSPSVSTAGWTRCTPRSGGTGGNTRGASLFYKVADASETNPPVFTVGNGVWECIVVEYSLPIASPLLAENSSLNASGTYTAPSVTPTAGKNAIAFLGAGHRNATGVDGTDTMQIGGVGVTSEILQTGTSSSAALGYLELASTTGSYAGAWTPNTASTNIGCIAIFDITVPPATYFPYNVSKDRQMQQLLAT